MNEKMASYKPISPFDFGAGSGTIKKTILLFWYGSEPHQNVSDQRSKETDRMYTIVFPYPLDFYTDFPAVL